MEWKLPIFSLTYATAIASCAAPQTSGTRAAVAVATTVPVPRVATPAADRASAAPVRSLGGFIAPTQNVAITSSLTEPATSVLVVEGQHVAKGQILATFDVSDLQASYDADVAGAREADAETNRQIYAGAQTIGNGESNAASAAATLAEAKQKRDLDAINLRRDATLLAAGFIAQQTYDSQAQTVASDRAAIDADAAAVRAANVVAATNGTQRSGLQGESVRALREAAAQSHAQARSIAAQIARAVITSPVDGVITNRNLNAGEFPGSRTLFTIQALSTVYADLNASSSQLAGIADGNDVRVRSQGASASQRGKVVAVLGQVSPGSTNFTVKVSLDNRAGTFLAGMAVTGSVSLASTAAKGPGKIAAR